MRGQDEHAVERARLLRLISNHQARSRAGVLRMCGCDLCRRAMARLEELRGRRQRGG